VDKGEGFVIGKRKIANRMFISQVLKYHLFNVILDGLVLPNLFPFSDMALACAGLLLCFRRT
jgi:hypothetical protein